MREKINPIGKLRILEKIALESYERGDFATFAATYDYFGLTHSDEDALSQGRADPDYWKKYKEIDLRYSSNMGISKSIRIRPFRFNTRK
ncbi:MAG: hypothetical protein Q8N99_02555 [Nanoarchaeota archaeon]|nr:hypothetical protein [Nanoarchaeota archaeon]